MAFVVLFSLSACVRLVSDYDEVLDNGLMEYAKSTDTFLLRMARASGTPDGTYTKNATFYDQSRADVSAMRMRSEAQPNNAITVEQIKNLESYLSELEDLHQILGAKGLTGDIVKRVRDSNSQAIGAVLALEIAKKRGGK